MIIVYMSLLLVSYVYTPHKRKGKEPVFTTQIEGLPWAAVSYTPLQALTARRIPGLFPQVGWSKGRKTTGGGPV